MPHRVFVSYRRSDSQQAAFGLFYQLCARLGQNSIFMDRSGIAAGDAWPKRLTDAVAAADVVLALIGGGWLTAADQYGRRRIDMPDDWVRSELATALGSGKAVIPVLLPPLEKMLPQDALPADLTDLGGRQAYALRDDHWDADVKELIDALINQYGLKDQAATVRLPTPEVTISPLTDGELHDALNSLPGWEPVESAIPGDHPKTRQELRKAFLFRSFGAAIDFMSSAVPAINKLKHHPRWENQWRTVTVHLSTWDVKHKITRLDVQLATELNRLYEAQRRSSR